jgi:hypothetical protein
VGRLIFASGQKQNLRNLHFLHPLWKTFFELFYLSIWNKNGKTKKIRILLLEIKNLRLGKCWEDFWKKPCYNDTDRKREPRDVRPLPYKIYRKSAQGRLFASRFFSPFPGTKTLFFFILYLGKIFLFFSPIYDKI